MYRNLKRLNQYEVTNCKKNGHYYDCLCLPCQSQRAFCTCSDCVERRTRFSGKFTDDRDFSRYPSMQQLVDLNKN